MFFLSLLSFLLRIPAPITLSPTTVGDYDAYEYQPATVDLQQTQPTYTSISPTLDNSGRTSQQSRRESLLHELQQRRPSQQSIIGAQQPLEIAGDTNVDKYAKDSFESEKPKSNRTSPISDESQSLRRRSSIRFSDDLQLPATDIVRNEPIIDTSQQLGGYDAPQFQETIQEYNQQPMQDTYSTADTQQQEQLYTQPEFTSAQPYDQSYSAGSYEQYDGTQYASAQQQQPQEYLGSEQYDTSELQYDPNQQQYDDTRRYSSSQQSQQYQPTYDATAYDQSYPSVEQQQTAYDTEQYTSGSYRDENNGSRIGGSIQQSVTASTPESVSGNANLGQKYRGNGNIQQQQQQPQQQQQQQFPKQTRPVPKQPPKKKF